MHKIAESDFVSYMYLSLITDLPRLSESGRIAGEEGGGAVIRGNKTKAVLAASVIHPTN